MGDMNAGINPSTSFFKSNWCSKCIQSITSNWFVESSRWQRKCRFLPAGSLPNVFHATKSCQRMGEKWQLVCKCMGVSKVKTTNEWSVCGCATQGRGKFTQFAGNGALNIRIGQVGPLSCLNKPISVGIVPEMGQCTKFKTWRLYRLPMLVYTSRRYEMS
jgi:hypothetical protein